MLRKSFFFFFNDTATTEIYTLSLHDALPILVNGEKLFITNAIPGRTIGLVCLVEGKPRSEEHTSELQSQSNLVCRLLLEKKKTIIATHSDSASHGAATRRSILVSLIANHLIL